MDKTIVVIDGHHLQSVANLLNVKIDFKGMREYLSGMYAPDRVKFFSSIEYKEGDEDTPYVRLLDWLSHNGYDVSYKEYPTSDKRDVAVDLATYCMSMKDKYNRFVLFVGDGRYEYLVEELKRAGCLVRVLSTEKAASTALRKAADQFIELKGTVINQFTAGPRVVKSTG